MKRISFLYQKVILLMIIIFSLTQTIEITVSAFNKPNPPKAGYEDIIRVQSQYENPFSDIDPNTPQGEAAIKLYHLGIVGGYDDGTFRLSQEVKRGEAAKFLMLTLHGTIPEHRNNGKFWDIPDDRLEWYVPFVMQAVIDGVISGNPDGSFRPERPVDRAQFMKMVVKTFALKESRDHAYYRDVSSDTWYYSYLDAARRYDFFPSENENFYPGKYLTRGEVAYIIFQILNLGEIIDFSDDQDGNDDRDDTNSSSRGLTRAETAALLVKKLDFSINTQDGPHCEDVGEHEWFYPYVETMVNARLLRSCSPGSGFQPYKSVNRAEAAAVLARIFREFGNSRVIDYASFGFTDVPGNTWYHDYVQTLVELGIIDVPVNRLFRPNDVIDAGTFERWLSGVMNWIDTSGGGDDDDGTGNNGRDGRISISLHPDTPKSQSILPGTDDIEFLRANLRIDEPFTADSFTVYLCSSDSDKEQIVDDLDNVTLFLGQQVIDSISLDQNDLSLTDIDGCPDGFTVWEIFFDNTYTVFDHSVLSLESDIDYGQIGNQYAFAITDNFLRGADAEYVDSGDPVPPSAISGKAFGNVMTIGESVVSVERVDLFETPEPLPAGTQDALMGWWKVSNNGGADLNIFDVEFTQLTSAEAGGPMLDERFVTGCRLTADNIQFGNIEDIDGGIIEFSGNHSLNQNTHVRYELYCDISTGAPTGDRIGFKPSHIEARDNEGNTPSFSPPLPLKDFAAFEINGSTSDNASLTVQRDTGSPDGRFLAACEDNTNVFHLKFTAERDDVQVQNFYLVNVDTDRKVTDVADGRISFLELDYGNGTVQTALANGLAEFSLGSNSNFIVPKGREGITVQVRVHSMNVIDEPSDSGHHVELATIPEAVPGGTIDPTDPSNFATGTVEGVDAISVNAGTQVKKVGASGLSDLFRIVKTTARFERIALSSQTVGLGENQELYRFRVYASQCGDADLGDISFDFDLTGVKLENIRLYDASIPGDLLNEGVQPGAMDTSISGIDETVTLVLDDLAPTTGELIAAGTYRAYILKADVISTGTGRGPQIKTRLAQESFPFDQGTYRDLGNDPNGDGTPGGLTIWSDQASPAHRRGDGSASDPGTPDWMSGTLFDMPSDFTVLTRR